MKILLLAKLFASDFTKQKKKITLTVLALTWGTVAIVMLLAFGEGMTRQLRKARSGLGGPIVILWGGETTIPYEGLRRGREIRFMDEDVELLKKSIPEIELISGEYSRWGRTLEYKDKTISEHLTGVYPSFEKMRAHIAQKGGRFLNELDMKNRRRVIFLGHEMKEKLFGQEEAVGKTLLLDNIPFTVIGVMVEKMQMGMYSGPDVNKATIPATTFKTIYSSRWPYLRNIVYQPKDPKRVKFVEREVYRVLGRKYKFDPEDKRALSIWDVIEGRKIFDKILLGIQVFLGIMGGLTLMIAGVGVANIMYVTVRRRTKEIGIKLALGARRGYIMWQFLLEAIAISAFGGAMGMTTSFTITKILEKIPVKEEGLQWLGKPVISAEIALLTAVALGIVGVASGYFPSLRASKLDPVESLRYE